MSDATADDGEILEGELASGGGGHTYPITNGIPRFVERSSYNESWDYKWTAIDRGRGLNYRIADKNDPAYELHDIFDRNSHGGRAWDHARDKMVLDIGCGVGQYSWRLMNEYAPAKVVSVDLTRGIDIFRKIMHERFPHLKKKFLLVQGNVFTLPFAPESFDYVFSLGVVMHTGDTRKSLHSPWASRPRNKMLPRMQSPTLRGTPPMSSPIYPAKPHMWSRRGPPKEPSASHPKTRGANRSFPARRFQPRSRRGISHARSRYRPRRCNSRRSC